MAPSIIPRSIPCRSTPRSPRRSERSTVPSTNLCSGMLVDSSLHRPGSIEPIAAIHHGPQDDHFQNRVSTGPGCSNARKHLCNGLQQQQYETDNRIEKTSDQSDTASDTNRNKSEQTDRDSERLHARSSAGK